jgi:hypothetical protein
MASFRYLSEKNINEFDEIGISHIIYSGYHNWCLVNEVVPSLQFAELVDYVEASITSNVDEINKVMKVWGDNQLLKDATDTKKKKPLKQSKSSHTVK